MKKTMLLIVLAMATVATQAQPALGRGRETKLVDAVKLNEGQYAGQYGKLDCWVVEGKKHQQRFSMFDLNLVEQYGVVLPKSGDSRVLAASMDATKAGVLVVDNGDKHRTVLGRYQVTLAGCSVEGTAMDTLRVLDYGKKDRCNVWGAVSPSGNYMAVVAIVEFTATSEYGTYIALFDAVGELKWSQEFALGTMSDMMVTDDGRVLTLGQEPQGEEVAIIVNYLTEANAVSIKNFLKCDPIKQLRLAALHGDHLLAVGTYGVGGGKRTEHLTSGMLSLAFNLDSNSLTNLSVRLLNNEEINTLYNKPSKKIQRELMTENYELLDQVSTDYGCAALYGRRYRVEYTNSAGRSVYDFVCVGLECMGVDTNGRVMWVRDIRRNDVQKEEGNLLGVSLLVANGRTSVVKAEHKKMPANYDVSKPAKELQAGDKANIVLYSFDAAGEGQKLVIEKGVKQSLVRALKRHDGSLLLLSSNGSKSRAAELRFVY